MQVGGSIIIVLGAIIGIVGELMLLALAFRKSVWWLIACLFLPIGELIFLILHWKEGKKAFLIQVVGVAILFLGVYVQDGFSFTSNL
jgi:hypothetical protein